MMEFSGEIVAEARRTNPKIRVVVKCPNWYESYHATGYNPDYQKNVFDMIYTGTETREPFYASQHLQRYESYGIMRLLENAAGGRNGGGWIDLAGSRDNVNRFFEQAEFTLLGGARELTLFNFPVLLKSTALPAMDTVLRTVDDFLDTAGRPVGTAVWEPFDAEGEDQLSSYLGMCGVSLEQTPEFPEHAPAILLTEWSADGPGAVEKLEAYVRNGGKAIVTTGFLRKTFDRGILDLTSVRLTSRHARGREYMIDHCDFDYSDITYAKGADEVLFEVLDYKTNATWADILMLSGENNFPVMTEDFYGRGRFLILNIPENFADLYRLPAEVISLLCKELSTGLPVFLSAEPKWSLIQYNNETFCLHSFRPMLSHAQVVIRGKCKGLQDIRTGRVYTDGIPLSEPKQRGDAARTRTAPEKYAFDVAVGPGISVYMRILR